jgi:hypothetical protein
MENALPHPPQAVTNTVASARRRPAARSACSAAKSACSVAGQNFSVRSRRASCRISRTNSRKVRIFAPYSPCTVRACASRASPSDAQCGAGRGRGPNRCARAAGSTCTAASTACSINSHTSGLAPISGSVSTSQARPANLALDAQKLADQGECILESYYSGHQIRSWRPCWTLKIGLGTGKL